MPGEEGPQAWIGKKVTVLFSVPGANPLPATLEGLNAYGVALRHEFPRTTEDELAEIWNSPKSGENNERLP